MMEKTIDHAALERDQEYLLVAAASALYTLNDAPGTHTITIPADPHGRWTYEFKEATNDRNHD